MSHTFHIPVLGLAYSVDTPLKVAKYGISSVVSIVDDELMERMRAFHWPEGEPFEPIKKGSKDYRAKRITAYLNLLQKLVDRDFERVRNQAFLEGSEICRYFEMLPPKSACSKLYYEMLAERNPQRRSHLQNRLRARMIKGSIDVNIMAKVDKINYLKSGEPDPEQLSDALSALKGFAGSSLSSSLTLSAGMNPRLYGYIEAFPDFYPDQSGAPAKKKIILKVSDFRSALIQAKFLAKKGLWVHEFRIESGLNCGGHAFATDGLLLGPILEEFKQNRESMLTELDALYLQALNQKGLGSSFRQQTRITVQGGIGTAAEAEFLEEYYQLDGTGWGSPFLLVPDVTNVDPVTLQDLARADASDFYVSAASPLGVPFNNFKKSSAEAQRMERIRKGIPGSPCTKKYLVSNTEFTETPICTASREYQKNKLSELESLQLPAGEYQERFNEITEKICLCAGLCTSAYIKNNMIKPLENSAVTICPGPNTAFFKGIYSLDEMVKHIYGKIDLLQGVKRPNMFINELRLYVEYLQKESELHLRRFTDKKAKQLSRFKEQLLEGINYYGTVLQSFTDQHNIQNMLEEAARAVSNIRIQNSEPDHITA